jgi:branched-chain amino acid transport system ATP-binding protein
VTDAPRTSDVIVAAPVLEVERAVAGFGVTTVLHGVDLTVQRGEVAGVFGLNGAGKSVMMKALAGIVPLRSGTIRYCGNDITSASPEDRVAHGMAHVPQGRQVFAALSVEQNLRLGAYTLRRRDRSRYDAVLAGIYDRFPMLAERRSQVAGTMSGGQQAALAVARALMAEPTLVLVDEPSAGLSPMAVQELFGTLRDVAATGVTMVLVEQNVAFGLQLVDTVHVLQTGRVVHRGPVAGLDQDTLARYLGIGRLLGGGIARSIAGRTTTSSTDAADRATGRRRTRRRREVETNTQPAAASKVAASKTTKRAPRAKRSV